LAATSGVVENLLLHSRNFSRIFSRKFHQRGTAPIPSNISTLSARRTSRKFARVDEKVFDAISDLETAPVQSLDDLIESPGILRQR
jgi:hypothetical protein